MVLCIGYQKRGKLIHIRRLPALDAIEEAVGRATEMGRPVHFTTGTIATLYSDEATQILAGLSVLRYVARLTARHRTGLIATVCLPDQIPLTEQIVRESYMAEGRSEDVRSDMVRHLSGEQMAYVLGVQGIFFREKVAANIMIGPLYAEALEIAETGFRVGAMQIGGTGTKTLQMPVLVAVCDFSLIGEEIYAAGAYISRDPGLLATILVEDIAKVGIVAMFIIGMVATFFGNAFLNLVRM